MLQESAPHRSFIKRLLRGLLASGSRRTLVLSALGALAGLGFAGVTMLKRIPPPVESVPPGYVALVNGKGILMSDYIAETMEVEGVTFEEATPAQRAKVLHDMINEEILVQRALVLDLPETTTEVRNVIVAAVNTQVAQPALAENVSDEQLKAYYNAHRAAFTSGGFMSVTDLVLHVGGYENADQSFAQAETDAAEAAYQLRSGADRRYVADHFGFVSGKTDGSEQEDFAAKLHLGEKLFEVARTMEDGQVSDPISEADGVHLLIMDKRTPPRIAAFESARGEVYADYRDEVRRRADEQNIQLLRRDAHILLAPGQHE
jgi:hypothetical protein